MSKSLCRQKICGTCAWFDWDSYWERNDGFGDCWCFEQKMGVAQPDWEACPFWEEDEEG